MEISSFTTSCMICTYIASVFITLLVLLLVFLNNE